MYRVNELKETTRKTYLFSEKKTSTFESQRKK